MGDSEAFVPEGLSYAADLAKTMKLDLAVLLIGKLDGANGKRDPRNFTSNLKVFSGGSLPGYEGVETWRIGVSSLPEAGAFLGNDPALEMVLISPGITRGGRFSAAEVNRFLKETAKPVVLISARHAPLTPNPLPPGEGESRRGGRR